jgi:hypothetical protein
VGVLMPAQHPLAGVAGGGPHPLKSKRPSLMRRQPELDRMLERLNLNTRLALKGHWLAFLLLCASAAGTEWPANRWIET